jgi:Uma2 family endonuclease
MASHPLPGISEEEYLALDRANEFRSEFVDGEMVAMSGGSGPHSIISGRLITELNVLLAGRGCSVYTSDMRIRTPVSGSYLYADVAALCGDPIYYERREDILTNPALVIEVLSPSTQDYDQTRKFELYRELQSLREYLLVDSKLAKVKHYSKQQDGSWNFRESTGLETSVFIPAFSISLELSRIYPVYLR